MAGLMASGGLVVLSAIELNQGEILVGRWSWVPTMGIDFTLLIDGLSLFWGLAICGVGVLVCGYAASYLDRSYEGHGRFYASLLLFAAAMLGTVFAENALLLVIFWELTGAASFLLIGFFFRDAKARAGARQALLVTAGTGLCLLVGVIMLGLEMGTYSFAAMPDAVRGGRGEVWMNVSLLLVLIGVFGKSAQFPFHFWLPGAMVAPTPVSVYLHSATMVKLGVFLSARVFPFYSDTALWFPLITGVCFFTMVLGSWLALRSNDLKAILAYSTVSMLGMLIGYYGLARTSGVDFDYLFIVTHVLYKAALFMMAGIVDHATGVRDIRRLGGLGRTMPVLAGCTAVSAAGLAGLPLTAGFLSKESLLAAVYAMRGDHSVAMPLVLAALVVSAVLSVAIAARIFFNVFAGKRPDALEFHHPGRAICVPVVILSAGTLLIGTFPGVFQAGLDHFRVAGLHLPESTKLALWHGFNIELATSAFAVALGAALYFRAQKQNWARTDIPRFLQFDVWFERGLERLAHAAERLTLVLRADWPPAYLPITIGFFLLATAALTATSEWPQSLATHDWSYDSLRIALVFLIVAAVLGVLFLKRWTAQLVALSVSGFFVTLYFVVSRAPDLAMTQILVEAASVVMILFLLSRFPYSQLGVRLDWAWDAKHLAKLGLSLAMGGVMGGLVLVMEAFRHPDPIGPTYLELTIPAAEGSNAVNTILVDFRGFDTLGEITVVLIAALGSLGLWMRHRREHSDTAPTPGFLLAKGKRDEKS